MTETRKQKVELGFFSYLFAMSLGCTIAQLPFGFLVDLSLVLASSCMYFGSHELLVRHLGKRKNGSINYDELIKFHEETERRKRVFG
jgi:hypothetical protein